LQLGLSVVWSEARKRGFSVEHMAEWMCRKPAELVELQRRKGAIDSGLDADFVVWDPDGKFIVTQEMLYHRHKVTPYENRELFGTVEMTFLRGNRVYRRGSPAGQPKGIILLRESSSVQLHREGSEAVATE
jgi:allantoinase